MRANLAGLIFLCLRNHRNHRWPRRPAGITSDPRSNSNFRVAARRSPMPSWSTRPADPSTPSRATRSAQNCSCTRTIPRWSPSIGTAIVRVWFSVGRSSSAKSGCSVLDPTPSTCSCLFCMLAILSWDGMGIRSRMFVHGDSQFKWMERPSQGFVSPCRPTTSCVRGLIDGCSSFQPTGKASPWPGGARNRVVTNSISRYSKRHLSSLAYLRRSSFRSYYSNPDTPLATATR
jgi:hypothetical protein